MENKNNRGHHNDWTSENQKEQWRANAAYDEHANLGDEIEEQEEANYNQDNEEENNEE